MKRQLVFIGSIAVPAAALVAATLTLMMAIALQSDVDGLRKRIRVAVQMERELHDGIEAIKNQLTALRTEPASAKPSQPAPAAVISAAAPNHVALVHAPYAIDSPRMAKINAAALSVTAPAVTPPPECIFKPGDTERLADCVRSQRDRIGGPRAQPQ